MSTIIEVVKKGRSKQKGATREEGTKRAKHIGIWNQPIEDVMKPTSEKS
jgi:hypothetical protein